MFSLITLIIFLKVFGVNAKYRGKIIILAKITGDEVYICIKKDDSTYEWKQITL